jgi:hypothetical protein
MLEENAIKLLKRAGWYENRKIDIVNQIKSLKDNGYEMFDAAYAFLQEYGNLKITLQYEFRGRVREDIHSTCYEDMNYYYEFHKDYTDKVGERTLPICELYEGEYVVHISESGKFFVSEGMWAEDSDNFWNGILGEYKGGFLNWKDYKAGKEFQRSKSKNEEYF